MGLGISILVQIVKLFDNRQSSTEHYLVIQQHTHIRCGKPISISTPHQHPLIPIIAHPRIIHHRRPLRMIRKPNSLRTLRIRIQLSHPHNITLADLPQIRILHTSLSSLVLTPILVFADEHGILWPLRFPTSLGARFPGVHHDGVPVEGLGPLRPHVFRVVPWDVVEG